MRDRTIEIYKESEKATFFVVCVEIYVGGFFSYN